MSSLNADAHDGEIGQGPEGRLAKAFTHIGACLQLNKICHHWLQPTLFDAWVHWLCLPIDFYFLMIRGIRKHQHVDNYITELCEWLWEPIKEVQEQSISEAERQKQYYDRKANAIKLSYHSTTGVR